MRKVKVMTQIPSAWIILGILLLGFSVVVFRLGIKAGSLSETDIITHYSTQYLENETADKRCPTPEEETVHEAKFEYQFSLRGVCGKP